MVEVLVPATVGGTSQVKKSMGSYRHVRVAGGGRAVVSQAGGILLVETARKTGLDQAISAALAPWCKSRAPHDPGKILLDVALAVALGGDCLADVGMLRAEQAVFGTVASDPTVSRLIDVLASAGPKALAAIRTARAHVREHVWKLAGQAGPDVGGQVIVDIDGVLVLAHSTTWQPATAVVYFGARPGTGPAAAVCCGYLRIFTGRVTAEQWTGQHAHISGAVLDQAEAERLGTDIFGPLLAAPAQQAGPP
ncbi:transposase [Streptomyces mirabilis]|uniref:transposase n=1 Tax=Streptomyces mirabilis TaxID=68239 RepID=UPI0036C6E19F